LIEPQDRRAASAARRYRIFHEHNSLVSRTQETGGRNAMEQRLTSLLDEIRNLEVAEAFCLHRSVKPISM